MLAYHHCFKTEPSDQLKAVFSLEAVLKSCLEGSLIPQVSKLKKQEENKLLISQHLFF